MKPIKLLGALSIAMFGLLLCGAKGNAGKPKPITQPTITNTSGTILNTGAAAGDLQVKWTESGLTAGTYTSLDYVIDGSVTSTFACVSGGGTVPITCACSYPGNCTSAAASTILPGGCDVQQGNELRGFELVGLSGSKTSVSNTVAVDEADSSSMNTDCANAGGSLLLYEVQYNNVTIEDTTSGAPAVSVGSGSFTATFCSQSRLSNCPPVS